MIADWRTEARRYELRDIPSEKLGLHVEAEERGTECRACPTCFAQGLKGILQFVAKLPAGGSI
jgi:hypothetical protein